MFMFNIILLSYYVCFFLLYFFFFFNDTATTEIYTLSLHDALPIPAGMPATTTPWPRRPCCRAPGGRATSAPPTASRSPPPPFGTRCATRPSPPPWSAPAPRKRSVPTRGTCPRTSPTPCGRTWPARQPSGRRKYSRNLEVLREYRRHGVSGAECPYRECGGRQHRNTRVPHHERLAARLVPERSGPAGVLSGAGRAAAAAAYRGRRRPGRLAEPAAADGTAARGSGPARQVRAPTAVLGPAGPSWAADSAGRGGGRGRSARRGGRLVFLAGLQAEPVGRAAGLRRVVGRPELAHRRLGLPQGPDRQADRRTARRIRPRHLRLRLADAAAHRHRQAGADQHPARLLRADPRARLQQDQRGARLRRTVTAGPDRGERHRAAHQPLHGDRVRRPGRRGEPGRRRDDLPADRAARLQLRRQPQGRLPDAERHAGAGLRQGPAFVRRRGPAADPGPARVPQGAA